jgi:hypothetical protein
MTMKLSKTFLAGILALALVFGMTLAGCDNGSTSDPAPAPNNNPLAGSWVDTRTTPGVVFIFTDEADAAITGAKVAYWSTNLRDEGAAASATGTDVTIQGTSYTYSLSGNTLTVNAYGTAPVGGGTRPDVIFDRAKGTSGSTMHGIWISRLASSDLQYTLLIIRTGTARTFTSVTSANGGEAAYSYQADATSTSIKWGNGNYNSYTKTSDPTQLTIPDPNGQQQPNLLTQPSW